MRRSSWSSVAIVLGGVLFLLAGIAGFLNANIVNGERFAEHADIIRQDDQVAQAVGGEIATAVVDASPDLVAVQPAVEAAAATVVASTAFSSVFTESVASFHSALTDSRSDSAVLQIADLGSSAVSLLEALAPDLARNIPDDLDLRLAQIGGQEGVAAQVIPWFQTVTALAWLLPVLAVAAWAFGVWSAPQRRVALLRVGWALVAVAAALGTIAAVGWTAAHLYDTGELTSALLTAAADEFGRALAVRAVVTGVVGGLFVVAASAALPQVDVHGRVVAVARRAVQRPATPAWAVLRALALVAAGALVILFPSQALAILAVIVGLGILLVGITELDIVAERARRRSSSQEQKGWRWAWALPLAAGAVAVGLVALVLAPTALPQSQPVVATADPRACNGYVELCDRPFDEVAFPASHNSMSAADSDGWYLAEQPTGLVSSLDDGIRVFLIDTWYGQATESGVVTAQRSLQRAGADVTDGRADELTPAMQRSIDRLRGEQTLGPEKPYMCHTLCELGATDLEAEMAGLKQWMDANPREVVTLFIQDAVTPADTAQVLRRTGLADLAHVQQPGSPWPTLGEMVDGGTRLLVLLENEGGGQRYPYLHRGFDLVQDTGFTYPTADDFDCAVNRGPADADLFLLNHWLSGFTKLVSSAEQVNTAEVLGERARRCREERGRIPNFVAVNWYDRGDLLEVVDELNGV